MSTEQTDLPKPRSCGMRRADGNDVSRYLQQAKATAELVSQCVENQHLTIHGTAGETLINSLWAIDDLLELAQHALNGGEVLDGQG